MKRLMRLGVLCCVLGVINIAHAGTACENKAAKDYGDAKQKCADKYPSKSGAAYEKCMQDASDAYDRAIDACIGE